MTKMSNEEKELIVNIYQTVGDSLLAKDFNHESADELITELITMMRQCYEE